MRRAARVVLVVLAVSWAGVPEAVRGATPESAANPDGGHDVVVDRAFVPSEKRPQGEVRLVRRGGQVVVQTILYTRVLKRVLSSISGKEQRNWPAGAAGHDDMERYVAALETYRREATAAHQAAGDGGAVGSGDGAPGGPGETDAASDRRMTMIIEFVDAGESTVVTLGGVDLEGAGSAVRVVRRRTPVVLQSSAIYVRRNMRLIVADAFHVSIEEAERRIAQVVAGPARG